MTNPSTSLQARALADSSGEVRVQEHGLPHVFRSGTFGDLGDRILIATDRSHLSRKVEARAMDIAAEHGATLLVVAITDPDDTGEVAASGRLHELAVEAGERGIAIEIRVESGPPVETIMRLAQESEASGIVVGDDQWARL